MDENIFSSLTSITLQGIKMSQKDLIEILLRRPTVVMLPSPCPHLSGMPYILDRAPERFADIGADLTDLMLMPAVIQYGHNKTAFLKATKYPKGTLL